MKRRPALALTALVLALLTTEAAAGDRSIVRARLETLPDPATSPPTVAVLEVGKACTTTIQVTKGSEPACTVARLEVGDIVDLEVSGPAGAEVLKRITTSKVASSTRLGIRAFLASAVALVILLELLLRLATPGRRPVAPPDREAEPKSGGAAPAPPPPPVPGLRGLVIGKDGRYSNSKVQMVLWFGIVITTYLTTCYLRWWASGEIQLSPLDIPENLLLLSGLSALTFAGAKAITQSRVDRAADTAAKKAASEGETDETRLAATVAKARQAAKSQATKPSLFSDLLCDDDGYVDVGDFQMLVLTLVAVATYLLRFLHYLPITELEALKALPDVDTTILASFGLGQGAYLAKKYASDTR